MAKRLLPTVEILIITPKMARKWLDENNRNNRRVSEDRVQLLVKQIKEGKFILSPDAIAFDQDDRLYNGQHRLKACVLANESICCVVLRDATPESFMITDIGMRKGGAHALGTLGFENASNVAALARIIYMIEESGGLGSVSNHSMRTVPPNDVVAVVEKYPDIMKWVNLARVLTNKRDRINTPATAIGIVLWHAFSCSCYDEMVSFLEKVASGEGLEANTPELILRRRLANTVRSGAWGSYLESVALICKAFKLSRRGEKKTTLIWTSAEPFPLLGSTTN